MWGDEATSGLLVEPYADAPGGERVVQYFDKSRMEINNPSADPDDEWYVTNGLLARDLVLGQVQTGDDSFDSFDPPEINVAGDFDDPDGPTYRTFNELLDDDPVPEGSTITRTVDRAGEVGSDESLERFGVAASHIEPATGHSVASVFWDFMNSTGQTYQDGSFTNARLFQSPYYATGYPLTEPYWADVRVGGEAQTVLIQVFERRVLTYTPDNPDGWKVESGNVGLHYQHWYYEALDGTTPEPAPTQTSENPTPSEPSDPAGADAATCLDDSEQEVLRQINDHRQSHGLEPLENSAALNVASYEHSEDMGERGYFSHVTPEGIEPWDRMRDAGYDYNTKMAENIAGGQRTARQAFTSWQNSEGHNRTMLDPELDAVGVARVEVPDSHYGVYWTTNFGGYVDAAPDC